MTRAPTIITVGNKRACFHPSPAAAEDRKSLCRSDGSEYACVCFSIFMRPNMNFSFVWKTF